MSFTVSRTRSDRSISKEEAEEQSFLAKRSRLEEGYSVQGVWMIAQPI